MDIKIRIFLPIITIVLYVNIKGFKLIIPERAIRDLKGFLFWLSGLHFDSGGLHDTAESVLRLLILMTKYLHDDDNHVLDNNSYVHDYDSYLHKNDSHHHGSDSHLHDNDIMTATTMTMKSTTTTVKSNQIKQTLLVVITVLHYDTDINLAFWRYNINEGEKKK